MADPILEPPVPGYTGAADPNGAKSSRRSRAGSSRWYRGSRQAPPATARGTGQELATAQAEADQAQDQIALARAETARAREEADQARAELAALSARLEQLEASAPQPVLPEPVVPQPVADDPHRGDHLARVLRELDEPV